MGEVLKENYCTVEDLQRQLGGKVSSSDSHVDLYIRSINAASRFIDTYTGRFYGKKTLVNEYVDLWYPSENGIKLEKTAIVFPCPIISITSIYETGTIGGTYERLVEDDDYTVYKSAGIVRAYDFEFTDIPKTIKINGIMGKDEIDENIRNCCATIAEVYTGKGVRTIIDEGGNPITALKNYIPKWVYDTLNMYRILGVA